MHKIIASQNAEGFASFTTEFAIMNKSLCIFWLTVVLQPFLFLILALPNCVHNDSQLRDNAWPGWKKFTINTRSQRKIIDCIFCMIKCLAIGNPRFAKTSLQRTLPLITSQYSYHFLISLYRSVAWCRIDRQPREFWLS